MSTNKYQNAPNRKTIQEAHYGVPLTGIALKHVRLMEHDEHSKGVLWLTWRYRRVKVIRPYLLKNGKYVPGPEKRKPLSADEMALAKLNIREQILRLRKLRGILAKSWLRVKKDQAALAAVTEVMKRMRENIVAYPFANILQFYEADQQFRPKLLLLSGMVKTHFSREEKRYGMVLKSGKRGQSTSNNRTLNQEIEALELFLLDGFNGAPASRVREIERLRVKKIDQDLAAWQEAMAKLSNEGQAELIERELKYHRALMAAWQNVLKHGSTRAAKAWLKANEKCSRPNQREREYMKNHVTQILEKAGAQKA